MSYSMFNCSLKQEIMEHSFGNLRVLGSIASHKSPNV
jgi:hypothetical protein